MSGMSWFKNITRKISDVSRWEILFTVFGKNKYSHFITIWRNENEKYVPDDLNI